MKKNVPPAPRPESAFMRQAIGLFFCALARPGRPAPCPEIGQMPIGCAAAAPSPRAAASGLGVFRAFSGWHDHCYVGAMGGSFVQFIFRGAASRVGGAPVGGSREAP